MIQKYFGMWKIKSGQKEFSMTTNEGPNESEESKEQQREINENSQKSEMDEIYKGNERRNFTQNDFLIYMAPIMKLFMQNTGEDFGRSTF